MAHHPFGIITVAVLVNILLWLDEEITINMVLQDAERAIKAISALQIRAQGLQQIMIKDRRMSAHSI
jgi:hypothetical protein